jgi:Carboxypeptidase regulatory-like domain/TonB dependent receptor/TonB-dependent Receptor Plug Domain
LRKSSTFAVILFLTAVVTFAQTESARLSGRVTDLSGAVIVGAQCKITNTETDVSVTTTTNEDGIYVLPDLRPAIYRLTIQKEGFRTVVQPSLQLYVQDAINENFTLSVGPASESVTVFADPFGLQTDSAVVSTVVDDQFVQNMPLNGRSFQSLIAVVPGVIFTSTVGGNGQFSVNGQRSNANYFMVDGVSANFGVPNSGSLNQTMGGAVPGLTSSGGTNGLVSIDAMREFRIQTSSYEAEFGRVPGAQISIVTKSGTNQFHGTAFDYLRNDIFDARNWFDTPPLPKPPIRQNDFGGTVGGPIWQNKTFFFFSYENLRLQLPQVACTVVYTASARAGVAAVYQPIINALPLPNGLPGTSCDDPAVDSNTAPLTVAYSNPSRLNAASIRIDQILTSRINLFVRYNHAPSSDVTRNWEELSHDDVGIDTLTAGMTVEISPTIFNDFRANWSRSTRTQTITLDNFHGAVVPPPSALFPTGDSSSNTSATVRLPGTFLEVGEGPLSPNSQTQLNFVESLSKSTGAHQLKFGFDYRRMNPATGAGNRYNVFPSDYASLVAGIADSVLTGAQDPFSLTFNNYSLFAQDTWKKTAHLTLTYGLRWEINPPPNSTSSSQPLYVTHGIFDAGPLTVAPGTLWNTKFANFAPRFGLACQITPKAVVRGGFGLFYDLGYGDLGITSASFPYSRFAFVDDTSLPFQLTNQAFQPPPFTTQINPNSSLLTGVDPNLRLPFTWQWNIAVERQLGKGQTLTATYVGSDARALMRVDNIVPPLFVGSGNTVFAIRNAGYAHYNALQVQFQQRMTNGLQALLSYSFAKASDSGSSDEEGAFSSSVSQAKLPPLSPSDFDIRHSFSGAVSYEIPAPNWGKLGNAVFKGWAVDGLERLSSAWPINVTAVAFSPALGGFYSTQANVVPGVPLWVTAPGQPAGKALNPAAFSAPAAGLNGDFPRNSLRVPFSLNQTDLAVRRRFNLTERLKLDLRVEYFNVFNHPMFGSPGDIFDPESRLGVPGFGMVGPTGTTNIASNSGGGGTGQNSLYAAGGPRSGQFTLKLLF